MATQVQIGLDLSWHPYLFLVFFATLFEYNLYRFLGVLNSSNGLKYPNYVNLKNELVGIYLLVMFSVLGFMVALIKAKFIVLLALAPIAGITLFYSTPLGKQHKGFFKLRQVPYLKIFMIAFVWALVTVLLPVIHAERSFNIWIILALIFERFLFVFAITIPFDIKDMAVDKKAGLKTIPLLIGKKKSIQLAILLLIFSLLISVIQYGLTMQWYLLAAMVLSVISTIIFILYKKMNNEMLYHYGILDGTMLLQGFLIIISIFIKN
jgi:4-hydroxybenzoate polyprenyltransferase